jgi:hypothetical protein
MCLQDSKSRHILVLNLFMLLSCLLFPASPPSGTWIRPVPDKISEQHGYYFVSINIKYAERNEWYSCTCYRVFFYPTFQMLRFAANAERDAVHVLPHLKVRRFVVFIAHLGRMHNVPLCHAATNPPNPRKTKAAVVKRGDWWQPDWQ